MMVDVWGAAQPVNASCHSQRPPDVYSARRFMLPETIAHAVAAGAQSHCSTLLSSWQAMHLAPPAHPPKPFGWCYSPFLSTLVLRCDMSGWVTSSGPPVWAVP